MNNYTDILIEDLLEADSNDKVRPYDKGWLPIEIKMVGDESPRVYPNIGALMRDIVRDQVEDDTLILGHHKYPYQYRSQTEQKIHEYIMTAIRTQHWPKDWDIESIKFIYPEEQFLELSKAELETMSVRELIHKLTDLSQNGKRSYYKIKIVD